MQPVCNTQNRTNLQLLREDQPVRTSICTQDKLLLHKPSMLGMMKSTPVVLSQVANQDLVVLPDISLPSSGKVSNTLLVPDLLMVNISPVDMVMAQILI